MVGTGISLLGSSVLTKVSVLESIDGLVLEGYEDGLPGVGRGEMDEQGTILVATVLIREVTGGIALVHVDVVNTIVRVKMKSGSGYQSRS